jgi:hypothetical protein
VYVVVELRVLTLIWCGTSRRHGVGFTIFPSRP